MGSKATSSFSRKDQLIKLLLYKDPPHHQIRGIFFVMLKFIDTGCRWAEALTLSVPEESACGEADV